MTLFILQWLFQSTGIKKAQLLEYIVKHSIRYFAKLQYMSSEFLFICSDAFAKLK